MTFPGKKNHLLNRAKRLIDSRNKTLNTTEKSFLSLGMGLLLVFSFATARTVTPVDKKLTQQETVAAHHEIDTVYAGEEKSAGSFRAVAEDHTAGAATDTVPVAPKRKAVPATTPAAPAAPSVPGSPAAVPAAPAVAPRSSVPADVVAPVPPVPPAKSSDFSSKSTNSHTVDKNRELTVEATSRDGHDYRLRKTNDRVKELVIDGVKIDPASYKDHKELIDKLDSPDNGRKSMDFNKSEWKKTDSVKNDKGQRFRVTPDKKAALNEDVVAKNMQAVNNKMQQRNLASNSEVTKRKIAAEARKADAELRKAKLDQQNKRHNEQRKAASEQMLKIVEDLRAYNVAFDMDKSWFALDPKKFVVDGQSMTETLHKTFTQKYLTGNGMGYYLGNVKLDGRGIFLSNKDLASR